MEDAETQHCRRSNKHSEHAPLCGFHDVNGCTGRGSQVCSAGTGRKRFWCSKCRCTWVEKYPKAPEDDPGIVLGDETIDERLIRLKREQPMREAARALKTAKKAAARTSHIDGQLIQSVAANSSAAFAPLTFTPSAPPPSPIFSAPPQLFLQPPPPPSVPPSVPSTESGSISVPLAANDEELCALFANEGLASEQLTVIEAMMLTNAEYQEPTVVPPQTLPPPRTLPSPSDLDADAIFTMFNSVSGADD